MNKFNQFGIEPKSKALEGDRIPIDRVFNKLIIVEDFQIKPSKYQEKGNGKCLYLQVVVDNSKRIVFTGSVNLQEMISNVPKDKFPFETTIIKNDNKQFIFT